MFKEFLTKKVHFKLYKVLIAVCVLSIIGSGLAYTILPWTLKVPAGVKEVVTNRAYIANKLDTEKGTYTVPELHEAITMLSEGHEEIRQLLIGNKE